MAEAAPYRKPSGYEYFTAWPSSGLVPEPEGEGWELYRIEPVNFGGASNRSGKLAVTWVVWRREKR